MFTIRGVAAALSVALVLQPVDGGAAVFRFDVDGTTANALAGTSIVAGTSFEATAFLDTSSLPTLSTATTAQFVGAVTFGPIIIGGFAQTPLGSGYVNTTSTSLFMNTFVDGDDAPFAPLGGTPLVRINLSGVSLPNPSDMSSLTLANLLAATLTANLNNNLGQGVSINISSATISEVPIPAALPLFATGLGALLLIARRRNRDKHPSV